MLRVLGKKHAVDLAAFMPSAAEREYLPVAEALCEG